MLDIVDNYQPDKHCLVYCGDDFCNCSCRPLAGRRQTQELKSHIIKVFSPYAPETPHYMTQCVVPELAAGGKSMEWKTHTRWKTRAYLFTYDEAIVFIEQLKERFGPLEYTFKAQLI